MKLLIRYSDTKRGVKKVDYFSASKELIIMCYLQMENMTPKIEHSGGKRFEWIISEIIIYKGVSADKK